MDFQSVPPSRSGGGGGEVGKKEWTVVMHGEKKISRVKEESCPSIDKPRFTVLQLQELQQQTLIHRHITAGLPVPFHLVLPIWKSVASSFGTSSFAFYNQFPSFRGFSPQGFGYGHMMDTVPEPRRCRRTDGKKWRCSKNVVPGEKYCEQHMHRGRQQRSRKLVEASQIASPSNPTTTREGKPKGEPPQNPSSNILGLQLMTPPSNANHGSTPITSNLSNKRVSYVTSPCFTTNTTSGNGANTSAIVSKNSVPVLATNDGKDASEVHLGNTSIIKGSNINDKNICVGRNVSQGLGFSPKTVLQVVHCNGLYIDNRNGVWLEPRRCRRTDGKKWRCRRDIIPGQKYCARHMHRGAKKVPKPLELTASSGATNTAPLPPATAMATARSCKTDHASPNTNLSMSILTSQPPISNGKKSDSGNSSDTTITDTSIGACASSKVPT